MKFSLFLHMERYDDAVSHRRLYEELLQLCDMAEAGGLHYLVTFLHPVEETGLPSGEPSFAFSLRALYEPYFQRRDNEHRVCQ